MHSKDAEHGTWTCAETVAALGPGMGHSSVPTHFLLHMSFYQDGDFSTEDGPLKSKTCSQQDKSLNQEQFQAVCD